MSRLTELIRQAKESDPALGAELEREYRTLADRRAFGLNFERHRPEAVELPGDPSVSTTAHTNPCENAMVHGFER